MTAIEFQKVAKNIPTHPGIYKYFDSAGNMIYVGKAKNLRKRVSSYFNKTFTGYKTYELVQRISAIDFTIVNTEQDAFLLENALIKEFQPRFNINLKDDKSYPFIVIKKEPFPRIFLTRYKINDGSEYLGPFTSAGRVRELINFIRQFIPLRTCKLNLTKANIQKNKFKVCLEYHLGNCKGPCEAFQSEEDYNDALQQVKNMLRGNLVPVLKHYKHLMHNHALNMEFEKAELVKKKIDHLEKYQASSVIVSRHLNNIDVFTLVTDNNIAFVNYLMVQNGTIVQTHSVELHTKLDETQEEVLSFAIANLRQTFSSSALEVIVPFAIDYPADDIMITVPKGGDKKKLLDLSLKNARYCVEEAEKKRKLYLNQQGDNNSLLMQLQKDLHLADYPYQIECFDNSNFQGSYPVSAMVCFKNGEPSKKDYRHYNVKTVKGINDFATMGEVVLRRYKRLKEENQPLPQLVIIDGGKGQLSAAMTSIEELGLRGKMTVVGLAKNEEEIFFPDDKESKKLSMQSNSLKLIRRMRDEVHRFGISFHRKKRSKATFVNALEHINGIGEKTATALLKKHKSVKNIEALTVEELTHEVGSAKAKIIREHFIQKKGGLDKNPAPF